MIQILSDLGKSFDFQRKGDWHTKRLGHWDCVSFVKALQNYQELFLDSPLDSGSFINFSFS